MSKNFWGEFWQTLIDCGFHPFEIRQEARALEVLRTAGVYSELY